MSELESVFNREAREIDPLFYAYRAFPSLASGRAYEVAAMTWTRDAAAALQAPGASADRFYAPVGQRFDVVVKHIQEIDAAGHGTAITSGEMVTQFVSDTASGVRDNAIELYKGTKDDVGKLLVAAIVILALIAYIRR